MATQVSWKRFKVLSELTATTYVPGVCNINREEVAYRRKWRNIGAVTTVVLTVVLLFASDNRWLRLLVFLPAFITAINYLQTKNKFCVAYAVAGLQNAAEGSNEAAAVDAKNSGKDKAKARKMNLQAVIAALSVTAIALII